MNLDLFQINKNSSIQDALVKIDNNHKGFILVTDDDNAIIGISTDGDIRRKLFENITIKDKILFCTNLNFVSASLETPKEMLLKQLDHKIRAIPILDSFNKLVTIVTKDHIPQRGEEKIYARAKSPVRISFGGGGSDTSSYFISKKGAVINATISLYTHSTLKIRDDERIIINSLDLGEKIEFNEFRDLLDYKGRFSLIQSVIKVIKPAFGFELYLHSDFPMNSGLGGSAAVTSSVLGCFNQLRNDKWDQYEIAEIAFQAERLNLGVAGGWQDQYATVFGGLNFMEFNSDQNIIHPIRLVSDIFLELEESLVLCFTGLTHDSGNIHDDQKEQTKSLSVKDRIESNVQLTLEMRNYLLKGKLFDFGKSLHKAWELKKSFSTKISNPILDEIYDGALQNGAIGGKLLGAGGGGFFLFYVQPFDKLRLINWLESNNLKYTPFVFEDKGLQSWTVREKNN
jgi:D-glycero-alpha-D-manno-heptose-7-phosphate kinase